jgi:hypothetical protein
MLSGNGASAERLPPEPVRDEIGVVQASAQVQEWLERSWQWFAQMGDFTNSRAILEVIGRLSDGRSQLMEEMQQASEQQAADALVRGR